MDKISKAGIWFCRVLLLCGAIIFLLISIRYLTNPVSASSQFKISLGTPTAITNMRIGFGAVPLGLAIVIFSCLFSKRKTLSGLYVLGIMMGVASVIRTLGLIVDGATQETVKVLRPEIFFFCFSVVGILFEYRRIHLAGVEDQ